MRIQCPSCDSLLEAAQLNVTKDLAVCPNCHEAFSISSIINRGGGSQDFDINRPPPGISFEDHGTGWKSSLSTRSAIAFVLVPFMCVWSGISLGGIYGTQILSGKFNLMASLFGIPFALGTVALGSLALMSVFGKVVVSTDYDAGRIFTGIGSLGWTQKFDWMAITAVEEQFADYRSNDNQRQTIALIGQSRIQFGTMLSNARRYYLLQALRKLLAQRPA